MILKGDGAMANIFDYLDWRGDIPLSIDPFSEVDALVLSELAYTKFEDAGVGADFVTLKAAREAFFKVHTREELLSLTSFTAKAPLLMDKMVSGARFGNIRLFHYLNEVNADKDAQFSAVTFILDDDTAFVAMRGTDGTVVGWKEDFNLSYLSETEGQRRAVEYLNTIGRLLDNNIRVGGHSKGGNFAVFASSFCEPQIKERIGKIYSFDAPGLRDETINLQGYKEILPKIIRVIPDTSIIGNLLTHEEQTIVVRSNASGIAQHDGFSWEVLRNDFVNAQVSELGLAITKTMSEWLSQTDDEERQFITDTVFTLIESTGNDTFREMSEQKWKTAESMLASIRTIPKEKRQEFSHQIGKLLQTGRQTAAEFLPRKIGNK